ncbi:LIM/homeobox protein Lhx9-like [Lytechinus variegatus]|uniref:LIM/homeobox protein Lhx9-like n=1 Tax=Lytechinus variegatus TaxID=7654 RepID=UPI001BB2C0FB|nr:LIM/homeobox protein Lhx9-like [Lytechinus variegatus]XP_041481497.1 LIM/homeobox protein Lhx9-like [Lytechinus variegatus]XP_041481498.1 LIM/homeobox protein Lhx9-like [Lytechinus variegatus]
MPVMGCEGELSVNSPGSYISNNSLNSSTSSSSSSVGGGGSGSSQELVAGSPAVCAGCSGQITDRFYLLAADRQWHTQCLQCCECSIQLDSELSCFAKEGNIYCKEDYLKRYGNKKCARCQVGIESHEMVMRARELVYHLACFSCAVCNLELTTGDYYGMRDNLVYCQLHYETLFVPTSEQSNYHHLHHASPQPQQPSLHNLSPSYHPHGGSPNPSTPSNGHPFFQNGLSPIHKGRPRKRKGVDHLIGFGMGEFIIRFYLMIM